MTKIIKPEAFLYYSQLDSEQESSEPIGEREVDINKKASTQLKVKALGCFFVIPTGLFLVVDYQSFTCCFLNGVTKVVQHFLWFGRA